MTVTEKAYAGNSEAMRALYASESREAMFLCTVLLGNKEEAAEEVPKIFKRLWEELISGQILSEEEFHKHMIRRTVNICRVRTAGKDPKAFRMPCERKAQNTGYQAELPDAACEKAIKGLPPLYRFIYVIHGVCCCESGEISRLFKIKKERVKLILNAEELNLNRGLEETVTSDAFHQALKAAGEKAEVPEEKEQEILETIERICAPIREKRRKRQRKVTAIVSAAAALLTAAVVLIFAAAGFGGESAGTAQSSETETSSGTASESETETAGESETETASESQDEPETDETAAAE